MKAYFERGQTAVAILQAGVRQTEEFVKDAPLHLRGKPPVIFIEIATSQSNNVALEFTPELAEGLAKTMLAAAEVVREATRNGR